MDFTGEEGLGRYLDLHDLYLRFFNLRSQEQRAKGGKGVKATSGGDVVDGTVARVGQDGSEIPEEGAESAAEKPLEYYEYLTSFSDFSGLPRQLKMGKQYRYALNR